MGFADFFSRDSRGERSLKKNLQKALDKHAQSPDRFRALEALRDDGSPEAILGLLRRFSLFYDKSIEDEQEKEWVYQILVEMGDKVLPSLRRYLRDSETLAWGLRVLEAVVQGDRFREMLRELCEQNDNAYTRDPTKKIQLLHFLGDHRDPELARMLLPYLEDMVEDVRFHAVEALLHQRNDEVTRLPLLGHLLAATEDSRRIKIRIVDGFAENEFSVTERAAEVERVLPELISGARLGKDGRLTVPKGRQAETRPAGS